jgi:hypothetical protein
MKGVAAVEVEFFSWMDEALSRPLPTNTEAFHFNLYEGEDSVHVQLVGTEAFNPGKNPSTDYWPATETFSTGQDIFEVPFAVAGSDWREWLRSMIDLIHSYLARGSRSALLRSTQGVGVGFVDGDMHVLWRRDAV